MVQISTPRGRAADADVAANPGADAAPGGPATRRDFLENAPGEVKARTGNIFLTLERFGVPVEIQRRAALLSVPPPPGGGDPQPVSHALHNSLGVQEIPPNDPNFAAAFQVYVNKGDSFEFNFRRTGQDGRVTFMRQPFEMTGEITDVRPPELGKVERRPDPADPTLEIITIKAERGFKGYLTLMQAGEMTPVNVGNGANNDHLKPKPRPVIPDAPLDPKGVVALKPDANAIRITPPPGEPVEIVRNGLRFGMWDPGWSGETAGIMLNRVTPDTAIITANYRNPNLVPGEYSVYTRIEGKRECILNFTVAPNAEPKSP